jgi:hypothetical protein
MKTFLRFSLVTALVGGSTTGMFAASRTISANSVNGQPHPGTTAVKGPAKVTCVNASQSGAKPNDPPASCYVTGPGLGSALPKGASAGTSGAGTVTLTCNGIGNLSCSARVDD